MKQDIATQLESHSNPLATTATTPQLGLHLIVAVSPDGVPTIAGVDPIHVMTSHSFGQDSIGCLAIGMKLTTGAMLLIGHVSFDAVTRAFSQATESVTLAIAQEREYLEASLKIEKAKKLQLALANGVRVDTDNKDEWHCVVGPYKYVNMICPGEAHHIISDMVYRLGIAPANAAEKDSNANRIPNSPTYNQGQAICLTKAMHRTDDDAVHKSLNPALDTLGQQ